MKKIRVLIVDDSPLVRLVLSEVLSSDAQIEVVGTAPNARVAQRLIKELAPDVLTLDVEMPGTDGLSFLKLLMQLRPMPVVMVSSYTQENSEGALLALELGAFDCVPKPANVSTGLVQSRHELIAKVKAAAQVNALALIRPPSPRPLRPAKVDSPAGIVVAIGASVGGTEAVREILAHWPEAGPPVVLVQHIASQFSASFARSLSRSCPLEVRLAQSKDRPERGTVLVAPGDQHMELERAAQGYVCVLSEGERVEGHRPSVDVLFHSVARTVGAQAVGILLTGMGEDGARGLLEIRRAGGKTIAQDEATSVIWGMPGTAVRLEAAAYVLPLDKIGPEALKLLAR